VIAVGDFDADKIERIIKEKFGRVPASAKVPALPQYDIPDHEETLFAIASDPEANRSGVSIYFKQDQKPEETIGDYRQFLVQAMYNSILNQRLYELTKQPNPPFLFGYSSKSSFGNVKDLYVLGSGVQDNGILRGLE